MQKNKNDLLSYQGRKASSYLESIAFYLINKPEPVTLDDLGRQLQDLGHPVEVKKLKIGIANFSRMNLVKNIRRGTYQTDPAKLGPFLESYLKGTGGLWHKRTPMKHQKSTRRQSRPKRSESLDSIRAILAAYVKPLSIKDIQHIAHTYGLKTTYWSIKRFIYYYPDEIMEDPLKDGKWKRYNASPLLFSSNAHSIGVFLDLFPQKEKEIISRFNSHVADLVEKPLKQRAEAIAKAQQMVEPRKVDFSQVEIVRAIYAAHDMSLCGPDIKRIAAENGLPIAGKAVSNFGFTHKEEVITTDTKGVHIYKLASPILFEKNGKSLGKMIEILPAFKDKIINNFAAHVPAAVADYIDIEKDRARFPVAVEKDQDAKPPEDKAPAAESGPTEPAPEENDPDMIDAALVGGSIIAYTNRLKRELKIAKANAPQEDVAELKKKVESLSDALVTTRASANNYKFQVEKLEKIIDEKDRRLNQKTKRIEDLENKLALQHRAMPGTFKINEVARVTRLIKGDRTR